LYQGICPLPMGAPNCQNRGFFEAVDTTNPTAANFDAFIQNVLNRNPPNLTANSAHDNTYNTSDGRKIVFNPVEPTIKPRETGIKSINGNSQPVWTVRGLAEGNFLDPAGTPLIMKTDAPVVTIKNPRFQNQAVVLDFGDRGAPQYAAP